MGGSTGGGGGGEDGETSPPQTFQRLALCLCVVHGKNRLQMVLVPPPQSSRRGAALGTALRGAAIYQSRVLSAPRGAKLSASSYAVQHVFRRLLLAPSMDKKGS